MRMGIGIIISRTFPFMVFLLSLKLALLYHRHASLSSGFPNFFLVLQKKTKTGSIRTEFPACRFSVVSLCQNRDTLSKLKAEIPRNKHTFRAGHWAMHRDPAINQFPFMKAGGQDGHL